jgi:hypothetical protein
MLPTNAPSDFPRPNELGAVPGVQSKLLVREQAGRYVAGPDESETRARYELCEDLARQLAEYVRRKTAQYPEWSRDELQARVANGLGARAFGWGISPAETQWVLKRVAALAGGATT